MNEAERLGYVSYANGQILAELLGVDRWRVTLNGEDRPEMAQSLVWRYEGTYKGPQDGYYGQLILRDLAELVGGVAVFHDELPEPPGVVC